MIDGTPIFTKLIFEDQAPALRAERSLALVTVRLRAAAPEVRRADEDLDRPQHAGVLLEGAGVRAVPPRLRAAVAGVNPWAGGESGGMPGRRCLRT